MHASGQEDAAGKVVLLYQEYRCPACHIMSMSQIVDWGPEETHRHCGS